MKRRSRPHRRTLSEALKEAEAPPDGRPKNRPDGGEAWGGSKGASALKPGVKMKPLQWEFAAAAIVGCIAIVG